MADVKNSNQFLNINSQDIRSLREIVVESLRDAIVAGHFKPGDHLKERELSEQMGISTTPIKEAFRILGHEGLVETIPRRGTFVSSIAETSIEEIQLLRAAVEGLSAKLAAIKITDKQIAEMENQIEMIEFLLDKEKTERIVEENTKFHQMIREAAASPMVSKILENISSFDKAFRKRALNQSGELHEGFSEHRKIFNAIKSKDPDLAEQVMKNHIMRTMSDVLNKKKEV